MSVLPPWPAPVGARLTTLGSVADKFSALRPARGDLRIYLPTMDGKPAGNLKSVTRGVTRYGGHVTISQHGRARSFALLGGENALDKVPCWIWTRDHDQRQGARAPRPANHR